MSAQLYLITPPVLPDGFADTLAAALDAGRGTAAEAACVQLRLKGPDGGAAGDDRVLRASEDLLPVCAARAVSFLVNDRADLARRAGADGVHLGQRDGSVADARRMLGDDADIGVTCHDSYHLGLEAGEAGADYVAFGAFYPSATKDAPTRADPDILRSWSMMTVLPCVAIGGITPQNARPLVEAGADYLAVSASVWSYEDGPEAAIRAFAGALR